MNQVLIQGLIDKALAESISFPEILANLTREAVEPYHVDFLRNECRYYAANGESFVTGVALVHGAVALEFSAERLAAINKKVQSGEAWYPGFVREAAAAGCAYNIVYLNGKKDRYFGRNGGEHVQYFPGAKP